MDVCDVLSFGSFGEVPPHRRHAKATHPKATAAAAATWPGSARRRRATAETATGAGRAARSAEISREPHADTTRSSGNNEHLISEEESLARLFEFSDDVGNLACRDNFDE
jgi:hypothetical protein